MVDHVKSTLRDDKPDHIILHAGINDQGTTRTQQGNNKPNSKGNNKPRKQQAVPRK